MNRKLSIVKRIAKNLNIEGKIEIVTSKINDSKLPFRIIK